MFWCRPQALKPLLDLELDLDEFERENGQMDGTLAHAIERLFLFTVEKAGYFWLSTKPGESSRLEGAVANEEDLDRCVRNARGKALLGHRDRCSRGTSA
jgi:hypothetical protein